MRRALDGLYAFAGVLAAGCVFAILALMVWASLGRAFAWRVGWVNDVVSWLCAAAAFLGMAWSFRNGDFVRVTLLLETVRGPTRRILEVVSLVIAALATGYLAWWAVRFTWESWAFNEIANNMVAIPIWIPQASFALGTVILLVAVLDDCLCVLRGREPSYTTRVAQRHAQGDFSQDL